MDSNGDEAGFKQGEVKMGLLTLMESNNVHSRYRPLI